MTEQTRTNQSAMRVEPPAQGRGRRMLVDFGVAAGMALLGLGVVVFYLRVFGPVAYIPIPEPVRGYQTAPMEAAIQPAAVRAQLDTIMSFGSRMMGQPGVYRTEDYFRSAYKAAGLEVYEHHVKTVAPHTAYREIYLVGDSGAGTLGRRLSDVEIYPFHANYLQPVVTPDTGLVGTLVLLDPATLRTRQRFDDCIGLIDSREGMVDPSFKYAWTRYARLGLKAIIVSHRDGLERAPWTIIGSRFSGIIADAPVNFVRVAATQGIFKYLGRSVRLRVRVDFTPTPNTSIYGVLRAAKPASEAVVLVTFYDACSYLPDLSCGTLQAVSPAVQLQMLKGLVGCRETMQRDVIFVAYGSFFMASDGLNHLLRLLGWNSRSAEANRLLKALGVPRRKEDTGRRMKAIQAEVASNADSLALVGKLCGLFADSAFLSDAGSTAASLKTLTKRERDLLKSQFAYVLNTIVFQLSEPKLRAKVAFERIAGNSVQGPEFKAYLTAKREYDAAASAAGYGMVNLLQNKADFARAHAVRHLLLQRFDELRIFHQETQSRLEQEVKLVGLFDPYRNLAAFEVRIYPQMGPEPGEVLTIDPSGRTTEPAVPTITNVLMSARQRLGLEKNIEVVPVNEDQQRALASNIDLWSGASPGYWKTFGYPSCAFFSLDRTESIRHMGDPVDLPAMRNMESLRYTLQVVGASVLSLAHGNGDFRPWLVEEHRIRTFGGRVLVSNVGQTIVPNYPLKNALVAGRAYSEKAMYSFPYYNHGYLMADPYGRYRLKDCAQDWPDWWRFFDKGGFSNTACGYGDDGLIAYMKDEGEDGQRLFKSINLSDDKTTLGKVTFVTFRATPVTVLDLTNPQTMKDYTGISLIDPRGLVQFRKRCLYEDAGLQCLYVEPDKRFYVELQSGAPQNELLKMTRAFMLGVQDPVGFKSEKEIDGPGYLAADNPILLRVPREVGSSMAFVNGKRLALQNRYAMADEQTNEYHRKTLAALGESRASGIAYHESELAARDAVTYAELNHPVLRQSVMEAVLGILWYLGLLVPFVFFFEKLLFCNNDVRKQIAAVSAIFLVVFVLLRILHPAFHMVRSSLMILLGFIIILISGGITVLFSSKFKENLEELRKKQGKVSAAEVNTMGVVMSAFMLGLNNMHRRKMRTGLTCATLTLLTFVMICFTSVQNELVDENVAVGKAPYQGMLIKRDRFLPITDGEVAALRSKYGDRYEVSQRRLLIGKEDYQTRKRRNPELEAVYEAGGVTRRYKLGSAIQVNCTDPLAGSLTMLTKARWFTPAEDQEGSDACPVLIPDRMADNLGITIESVNQGDVPVTLSGTAFRVVGIFSSASLQSLRDMDSRDILPFSVENMRELVIQDNQITAGDQDPRVDADHIVITPVRSVFKNVVNCTERIVSVSVAMPKTGYKEARGDIEAFLEQTGQRVYYGLDGVAYRGRRTRAMTLAGIIDLLIPLLIAGLTVLNTMNGSVYERREEIFVYNAVGIAPRYVFFMFIAEAFVYAVVGSVLGYLLSQGTGRILTMLNLTGGLNMTFTSLATIYASLTIAAAVFLSTYYPARSAMEISAPAEESGWALPEPDEDELEFDLPFNFSTRGRIAVLAFFNRYLCDHGEGSAGRFFAGVPHIGLASDEDEGAEGAYVPQISTTIWLKPFDLAVYQRMTILMPPDAETGQYKARILIERLSGTRESWMRLNQGFVSLIRRHFLHWRAVSPQEHDEMYEEAKTALRALRGTPRETEPAAA